MSNIAALLKEAENAMPYIVRDRGMGNDPQFIDYPAASMRTLTLTMTHLPVLGGKDDSIITVAPGNIAGQSTKLDTAIIRSSRVAAAGANIIVRPVPANAYATGLTGGVSVYEADAYFVTVAPAEFASVADGAAVSVTPLPASRAQVKWDEAVKLAVRFNVPRRDPRTYGQEHIAKEILTAIPLGIARAADNLLLSAINAETPSPFTVAAASAQGLNAGELRALIGTDGTGAQFRADGQLIAAGIAAEMTPDMAGTIVGAFDRAAVAIHDEITLLAERLDGDGNLAVTCWVSMIPLLPDPAKFWTVA
ncbi:MAG: hypothetical protein RL651_299 [Pseudomonadota bacterium]|jgi:hypothetical protein